MTYNLDKEDFTIQQRTDWHSKLEASGYRSPEIVTYFIYSRQ